MRDRELLQQALDALISVWNMDKTTKQIESIQAIKARLTQPEKKWVGLTEKEIERMALTDTFWFINKSGMEAFEWGAFAKAIEAKLKEKNGMD